MTSVDADSSPRRAVRLKDVAALAGVSIKTVSKVINDEPHVKESTRVRVREVVDQLGYRPNLSARGLKQGKSGFIAVALPQLASPYFAELAARFARRAGELGYLALFEETGGTPSAERIVLQGMSGHLIDGVVFSPLALRSDEIEARGDGTPMVLLGERSVPAGVDHVAVDSIAAARAMTEHLLEGGRRRVGAIGRKSALGTHSVRLTGYRQALGDAGIRFDPTIARSVQQYSREEGRLAMHELLSLRRPPEAVFCFNDLMAIGALRACYEAGVRVPEDVAVAGFDNIAEGGFTTPTLTTIAPDLDALADAALRMVIARIDDPSLPAHDISVPWHLVVRESTVGASVPAVRRTNPGNSQVTVDSP